MRRVVAPSRRAVRAQRAEERRDARRGLPLASRVRVAEWRYPVARVPRRDVRVPRDPECGAFSMFDRPPGPVRAAGAWTWPPCAASSCGAPRRIASLREAPRARRAFAASRARRLRTARRRQRHAAHRRRDPRRPPVRWAARPHRSRRRPEARPAPRARTHALYFNRTLTSQREREENETERHSSNI